LATDTSTFARRMPSATALASGCGGVSGFIQSADISMMDGDGLHIQRTASTFMDSRQFLYDTFSVPGDPYPEFDNVTRCCDPSDDADVLFKPIASDDALETVHKCNVFTARTGHEAAVNLGCNNDRLENLSHDAVGMISVEDALASWREHSPLENLDCNNTSLEPCTIPYPRRFQATDVLPGVPVNVCFRIQPTTYRLRGVDAHVVANMLLDYLTVKATLTIAKVSHAKFSIKANICIDGTDCLAKLRIYSNNASYALALELQRRSGCGLVFNWFYQEVGCYLTAHQKSMQLELLSALERGSSSAWTNTPVGDDGMAEPAALMWLTCS